MRLQGGDVRGLAQFEPCLNKMLGDEISASWDG